MVKHSRYYDLYKPLLHKHAIMFVHPHAYFIMSMHSYKPTTMLDLLHIVLLFEILLKNRLKYKQSQGFTNVNKINNVSSDCIKQRSRLSYHKRKSNILLHLLTTNSETTLVGLFLQYTNLQES
ncbi:hypothetical protein AAHE18_12G161100 [Arachis hypogaea]